MLNLTILDAQTLGKDADFSILERFGQLTIHQQTNPEEVIDRIKTADIIISNKTILNTTNLSHAANAKLICIMATGTNNVDLEYARQKNIAVCNVAGYSTHSVAQHTFAMLFYLLENLPYYDHFVKSGQYSSSNTFTHLPHSFWEIKNKTWGIIGLGSIGRAVADIAQAFGCQVVYYSTSGRNDNKNYQRLELADLLKTADIISVHAPLNDQTNNLIKYNQLQQMKKTALILNLGRGGIINESDLARALDEELIAAAGIDVFTKEPMEKNNPLIQIKNHHRLLVTPHIAWGSIEARKTLINEIALNIESFINGKNRNRV